MDKNTLVMINKRIESGNKLLNEFKKDNISIKDAFWILDDDSNKWRLIISSPLVNKIGPLKFQKLISKYIEENPELENLIFYNISVYTPTDEIIKNFRNQNNLYNNYLVQDENSKSFIYHLSN
ncbi:MAG: hypothetical protein IAE65_12630 [Ignavibacteria bacterium]|nr:hypothetical protein [Ignavibacteria bacterium]